MNLLKLFSGILNAAPAASQAAESGLNFNFEPKKFVEMLPYMGKGMLVIFAIIAVIIVATVVINKLFSKKKEDK